MHNICHLRHVVSFCVPTAAILDLKNTAAAAAVVLCFADDVRWLCE